MQVKNSFSSEDVETTRSGWFPCSCCPTNLVRLIPSIPGYVYAQQDDKIFANLFISSNTSFNISGKQVDIVQQNNYPWDGDLLFNVVPKSSLHFSFLIRIPGWSQNEAMPSDLYSFQQDLKKKVIIKVNGEVVDYKIENGYAILKRTWHKNDKVEVALPMEIQKVVANNKVKDDVGKIALQRGPLIYCAEWLDNNGKAANIMLPANTVFSSEFNPNKLNGIEEIKAQVPAVVIGNDGGDLKTIQQSFVAIPYYAWANRGKGEMMIWFPEKIKNVDLIAGK
jgi:DUF1680 family protein